MDLIIALTVFAAVTAATWALIQRRIDARVATQIRLERVAGRIAADWNVTSGDLLRGSRLSTIPSVERLLQGIHVVKTVELLLIRADWSLRVSEYLAIVAVCAALALCGVTVVAGSPLFGVIAALAAGFLPVFVLKRAVKKRRATVEKQLAEALVMVANSLKAGFGLLQALDQAARQLKDPIAKELRQTVRDTQIGSSVEEAVIAFGARISSYDLEIVVTAILVQRNVGGNLAEILDGVAHTMRERERIRGEIATLTAQQRLTGFVIAGLPLALAALFFILNRDYMIVLFTHPIGRLLVAGGIVLEAVGAWAIKTIVAIEV